MVFQKDGKTVKTVTAGWNEELKILNTEICNLTDGRDPNVVVSGALNCSCSNCYVFSLGEKVKLISTVYTAGLPSLENAATDRKKRLRVSDPNLDFGAHGGCSSVLLKWHNQKFVIDSTEMKKQSSGRNSTTDFDKFLRDEFMRLAKTDNVPITFAPPEFTGQIVSMYYCGDSRGARKYFQRNWPKEISGKAEYWRWLTSELNVSPYWLGSMGSEQAGRRK
jgi:hypothetical protein